MYKVLCESDVRISEINQYLTSLSEIIYSIYRKYGKIPIITSGNDSKHMKNSLHYEGLAWDFRIWDIPKSHRYKVVYELRDILQGYDYRWDVVYGDKNHLNHIHIEFDIRKKRQSYLNALFTPIAFLFLLVSYIKNKE